MRIQTHAGALNGFILNALLGLTPIRIHGAERSLRRGQETLLVEWTRARYSLQTLSVAFEGLLTTASYALVVSLVFSYLRTSTKASLVLLLVFWALRFPTLGQRLLVLTRSFPSVMNRARRLLEMIGDVGAGAGRSQRWTRVPVPALPTEGAGVGIVLERVRVKAGGHVLLDKVSLSIAPGEHVAIVGPSGAGKSTLVGLLLGWLRPVRGEIRVDGRLHDQPMVESLRRATAWVDPAINLWNESLLDNLRYGNDASRAWSLDAALKGADMLDILEALPEGLQTSLGEGGGLVSGGQGQRVRLARAMLRANVRLAILDEPFRGLDRDRRARLLAESRKLWADITLLCVTHDVVQTQGFDRVLVIEGGRVVENGTPAELLSRETSRYAQLLRADEDNHTSLWRGQAWRHWWLADGRLRGEAGSMSPGAPDLLWPVDRLPDAIEQMAHRAGLGARAGESTRPDPAVEPSRVWMFALAGRLGVELEPVVPLYRELPHVLRQAAPAVLQVRREGRPYYLALLGARGARVQLLGVDSVVRSESIDHVLDLLREEKQANVAGEVERLLSPESRRRRGRARGCARSCSCSASGSRSCVRAGSCDRSRPRPHGPSSAARRRSWSASCSITSSSRSCWRGRSGCWAARRSRRTSRLAGSRVGSR